jgi:hypothetical protein
VKKRLDFDFRDDPNLPTDGMRFYLSHNNGFILTNDYSNYGKTLVYLEYFVSARPFTLGIKTGGGSSYGDIPFYSQFSLGLGGESGSVGNCRHFSRDCTGCHTAGMICCRVYHKKRTRRKENIVFLSL